MADFTIRFFLCNLFISGIIGILLTVRRICKHHLSSRMQYHLWFLLLGLLCVPFLPFCPVGFPQIFSWFRSVKNSSVSGATAAMAEAAGTNPTGTAAWMNNFALSVNRETSSVTGYLLFGIWVTGMLVMILFLVKSVLCLGALTKCALPLQRPEVRRLYHRCLKETGIRREIPVYSTAYLKSPVFVGFLKPRIYLPLHLISDYNESELRYMLLHELQHYRHKDIFTGYLMNLALVVYWFNPLVWYVRREMRGDREIACDASVLKLLPEDSYEDYGNTLIQFAEKVSRSPFPFTAGLSGSVKQMRRRILNIAAYEKPTFSRTLKGMTAFTLVAVLLFGLAPFVSTYAATDSHYRWDASSETISHIDLSAYFGDYQGSFVLYDLKHDSWRIHNPEHALLRVSPDSTYKIYDALFGLEEGVITPENSRIAWNGETYPFDAWNAPQTLTSAMQASVNWYFQAVDDDLGASLVSHYIQNIGYGNEDISGGFPTYWMESSLKISPMEQVELLVKLQQNSFGFAPENIRAVKDSILLSSSTAGALYGKTGTGRVNGQDVNGWFIGFIETAGNTCFFATNIGAGEGATGSRAAEITLSVLSDSNLWP